MRGPQRSRIDMEFRLARRLIARRPLAVAVQVAALFLGFLTAGLGFALHGVVMSGASLPGAPCASQARWISVQKGQGDWSSRFTPAQAHALRQLVGIPVYPIVYAGEAVSVGNAHIADTVLGINPDALAALCVNVSTGHLPQGIDDGAVLGAAVNHSNIRVGRAKVPVVGSGTAFRGLAPGKNPVDVLLPLDTLARAGFDIHTIAMPTLALFVSARTAAHLPSDAELTQLVRSRPDVFPKAKLVHLTHNLGHFGAEDYALGHYSRALGVLGVVLLLLGLVNVATYQLGRQADLAWRSKILRDLGAGRRALRVLAYIEPLVVTLGSLVLAWLALIPILRVVLFLLDAKDLAAHAQPTLASYGLVFGLALAAAIILGELRYRATGDVRSRAIRRLIQGYFTYASLIQAFACVAVLGVALAATMNYVHAQPAAPAYHVDNVRIYDVRVNLKKLPSDLVLRWRGALQRLGQRVHGVAAASLLLMPASVRYCCMTNVLRYNGKKISAATNYVTPGYFKVLGMRLEVGHMFGYGDLPRKVDTEGHVAILNATLAQRLSLVGRAADHVALGMQSRSFIVGSDDNHDKWSTVYAQGVVRVLASEGEAGSEPSAAYPALYLPLPALGHQLDYYRLFVRHAPTMTATAVDEAVRKTIGELTPSATIQSTHDLKAIVDADTAPQRSLALLFNVLALGALALVLCGIFGISLFQLELHRQDLAVRFSLGAHLRSLATYHALRVGLPLLVGMALGGAALAFFGQLGLVYLGINAIPAWLAAASGASILLVCTALAITVTLRMLVRADFHTWLRAE